MWFTPGSQPTGAAPREGGGVRLTCSGAHGCGVRWLFWQEAAGHRQVGPGQAGQEMEGGEAREGLQREVTTQEVHLGPGTLDLGLQLCLELYKQ